MRVPGIKAKHAIVTPVCRANRGPTSAAVEAMALLIDAYTELRELPVNKDADFHFVLFVERPEPAPVEEMVDHAIRIAVEGSKPGRID
jgi:hypothetical protein